MARLPDSGHGQHHGCYLDEELDRKWRSFHRTLDHFPHSFQLQDQEQLSSNTRNRVLCTLQADLEAGFPTSLETARALNLLGYLHFQLGRLQEALEQTEQALQQTGEERNVVSLGNRAAILWFKGNHSIAEEHVRYLESLQNDNEFEYLIVRAKAELAYSYTRLGGHFISKAVPIFTAVIEKAREPEVWLWKFGLALTERRGVHMNLTPVLTTDGEDARLVNVLRILLEVIEKSQCQNLKAKAYSEVAQLLHGKRGSESQKMFEQEAQLTPVTACNKALELDSNDSSILWKCGRIFGHAKLLDQSCELLKKSVERRPTTAECHHLGLSYKALAAREKSSSQDDKGGRGKGGGPESTRRRGQGSDDNVTSRERGRYGRGNREADSETTEEGDLRYTTEVERMSFGLARLSLDVDSSQTDTRSPAARTLGSPATIQMPDSSVNFSGVLPVNEPVSGSEDISSNYERTPSKERPQHDIRSLQCIFNCPSREETRFSRTDPFVQEAMDALKKAVDLSGGENIPAVYDLALMYKALGEFEEALKLLDAIQLTKHKVLRPFDKINAYEQAGLILKDLSETVSDEERRKRLNEEGESKLNMALNLCSSLCSRLPGLQYFIRNVWHAFPTLLQAAQDSDRCTTDKLREKARLFQLIKDNWQSMALLQEIKSIEPEQAKSPDYLKMCVENYVSLEQYDKALAFIKMLMCTAQGSAMDLFGDDQYVQKIYVQAGRAALLKATSVDMPNEAREYFSAAFSDAHSTDSDGTSSSEDSESVKEGGGKESWDIMLLHEDTAEDKAKGFSYVLEEACGLKVTRMGEDCLPGRPYLESVMCVMSRSRQVVVLAGGPPVKGRLRLLLEKAARKTSTVVLLVEGDHVPKVMKSTTQRRSGSRSMVCPEELLSQGDGGGGGGLYPRTRVQAVCDVFSFLIDIPSKSPQQSGSCL